MTTEQMDAKDKEVHATLDAIELAYQRDLADAEVAYHAAQAAAERRRRHAIDDALNNWAAES